MHNNLEIQSLYIEDFILINKNQIKYIQGKTKYF